MFPCKCESRTDRPPVPRYPVRRDFDSEGVPTHQVPVRQRLDHMSWQGRGLEKGPGELCGLQFVPVVEIGCNVYGKSIGKHRPIACFVGDQAFILELRIADKPKKSWRVARSGTRSQVTD